MIVNASYNTCIGLIAPMGKVEYGLPNEAGRPATATHKLLSGQSAYAPSEPRNIISVKIKRNLKSSIPKKNDYYSLK